MLTLLVQQVYASLITTICYETQALFHHNYVINIVPELLHYFQR